MQRPVRKMIAPVPERPAAARRAISQALRRAAGHVYLLPLLILLWAIVYQNLPDRLNFKTFKPFDTSGLPDRIVKICAIAISCAVIASRWSQARLLVKQINPGLVAFMVLIPMSAAWSYSSNDTLLRYVTLAGIVLLCLAIPLAGWERRRFQQVALPPLMFILVISLTIGVLSPDMVIEMGTGLSLENSWHGIANQKNQFGMMASIATILCVHRLLAPRDGRSVWTVAGVVVGLVCLALSRSSTSLLALVLAVTFMVLVMRVPVIRQRFATQVAVVFFTVIIVYELAVQNLVPGVGTLLTPVMSLTGKDMTFSNRSVIWDIVKEHSQAAPWLGTGYGAYWLGEIPGTPSYVFHDRMSFYPMESHNGYLEILNDLGRVGLVCLLAFLVYFLRQALRLMRFDNSQATLYLALLFEQMVANLSESEWFSRTTVCTILLLASTCLSRGLLEWQLTAQPAAPAKRAR